MPRKPRVRKIIDREQVKGSETLHKSARQHFCHIFWSLCKKISSKNSGLIVSEILRLFLNILTTRWNVFSLSKSECLMKPIHMLWSQNQKIFSYIFSAFPESRQNLESFEKNYEPQKLFVSEIKRGYLNAQKDLCQNTYGQSTC